MTKLLNVTWTSGQNIVLKIAKQKNAFLQRSHVQTWKISKPNMKNIKTANKGTK